MGNPNKFSMTEIDFDNVREKLKEYLQSQPEFTDYNFEGSGLSVLLNSLAYNTSYNLVYQNFAINEAFLDTAVKKSSVISHANTLNYTPRSKRSPRARVTVCIKGETGSPSILRLNAFSPFTTNVEGVSYTFYTTEDYTSNKDSANVYYFENVYLYEGAIGYGGGTYNDDDYQCFKLEDSNIDTTTIKVSVEEQTGTNVFTLSEQITDIDGESKIYFLKENPNETYQIEFGNGVLGQKLSPGDIVNIVYLSTNGSICNGAKTFEYSGSLDPKLKISGIICTEEAFGGDDSEDIEDIRRNAPKVFSTQNRCVSKSDYKSILLKEFQNAKGINVWGGEEMDPPQYGKAFISIVKKDGTVLTQNEKDYILTNIINQRKVLTTIVEFLDPTYIKLAVRSNVYYNLNKTNSSADDIKSAVMSKIKSFMNENIGSFDMDMKYSNLVTAIDNAEGGITNNETTIKLISELEPSYNSTTSYTIELGNSIKKSAAAEENILSSSFECNEYSGYVSYIDDDPTTSKLRIFHYGETGDKIIDGNIGSVDYETGKLVIDSLTIKKLFSEKFEFFIKPVSYDVYNSENQFSILDEDRLSINVYSN